MQKSTWKKIALASLATTVVVTVVAAKLHVENAEYAAHNDDNARRLGEIEATMDLIEQNKLAIS